MIWKHSHKNQRRRERESVGRQEMQACEWSCIPRTTCTQSEAACPEHIIPKAQGHLIAGRELCAALHRAVPFPYDKHQEKGMLEVQRDGERDARDGEDQLVSHSHLQLVVGRNNQPTHHVSQCQSMHLWDVLRQGDKKGVNISWAGKKCTVYSISVPLGLLQELGQHRLCHD